MGDPHLIYASRLSSLFYGDIIPLIETRIDLPGSVQLPLGVIHALLPLAYPARQTSDGEHDSEHVDRNANGTQNNARVEIHVWIEVVIYKIGIF